MMFHFQANKWCSRGSEILAGDDVEGYETIEEVENALKDVENFLETVDDLRLNNPREFRQMFDSMITPETRVGWEPGQHRLYNMSYMITIVWEYRDWVTVQTGCDKI